MQDTFPTGMAIVIVVVFTGLAAIFILEVVCQLMDWPSVGYRVEAWAVHNEWFAGGLLLGFGALLAHFLLNPLYPK